MKVLERVVQCVVGVMASREVGRDGNYYGHKSSDYAKHVTSDGNYGKGVERVNQSHMKEAESYMNAGRNSGSKQCKPQGSGVNVPSNGERWC